MSSKKVKRFLANLLERYAEQDRLLHGILWKLTHIRPERPECSYIQVPNDIEQKIFDIATEEAAQYVIQHMPYISGTIDPYFIIEYCVKRSPNVGLLLEFGVFSGSTINHIASFVTLRTVHGFDSFQGLPEDWGGCKKGTFSTKGVLPKVADNVQLHVGLFNDTLPSFLEENKENISFLHIDSDLYSSAKTIFDQVAGRIKAGTIILFDEYFNYPGWKENEYKAFQEFVAEYSVKYEYIAYCRVGFSVAVLILSDPVINNANIRLSKNM